jgi:hypothetical protein
VAVKEPLQFFLGFLEGAGSIGEVLADFRVAVKGEEVVEIGWFQVSEDESFGFEDFHRIIGWNDNRCQDGGKGDIIAPVFLNLAGRTLICDVGRFV